MNRIQTIIDKEWAEVFKNRMVLFTVSFLPLIFTVLPLVILYATNTGSDILGDMPDSAKSLLLIVAYQDSMLTMRFEPKDPYYEGAALIRIKDDWFIPGILEKGQLLDALMDMVLEFKVADGKAVSFDVRGDADELWARGKRIGR